MKAISQLLLNEQVQLNRKPAVKIQIQEYGFPAESSKILFNEYDWTSVLETSKGAAAACCASDGSFVITAGTGATTVRIANSPVIDLDTVFTSWGASGAKGTFAIGNTFCVAANPTNPEVIIIYVSGGYLYRQESADYGATWGGAINMGGQGSAVKMAYTPTGDLCILGAAMSYSLVQSQYSPAEYYCILTLTANIRRGGVWSTTANTTITPDGYKFNLGYNATWRWWTDPLPILEGIDIAYDDDWFIIYTLSQTQPGSYGRPGYPVSSGTIIYGLYGVVLGNGANVSPNSWSGPAEITLTETKTYINSISQLSNFSPSPLTENALSREQASTPVWVTRPDILRSALVHPAAFLHKVSSHPLILSLWSEGRVYLCELKRGTNITTATFNKAYTFYNDRPVKLCSNSSWLFAYNGDQIFMSPLPGFWNVPTMGTGPGDYIELGE